MRIAVVGAGVAGLHAAWRLSREHDVTLYEANDYAGGHTATVDIEWEGRTYGVDTGFIVFKDWTYPNFIAMLRDLGVAWQPSNMSFSLRCGSPFAAAPPSALGSVDRLELQEHRARVDLGLIRDDDRRHTGRSRDGKRIGPASAWRRPRLPA